MNQVRSLAFCVSFLALISIRVAAAESKPASVEHQTQSAAQFAGEVSTAPVTNVHVNVTLPHANRGGLYVQNKAPLTPAPFMKLPIGAIEPRGWLRGELNQEAEGMTGHLAEISPWLDFGKSSWAAADGSGQFGWEEMPYWLKGFGDLGYVLKDEKLIGQARKWIEAILRTQREDGYYGPRMLLTSLKGQPDLWPHMLVNNILQSWHEYSRDERVLPFLMKYHRWLNAQPPETFAAGYWPRIRWGDNIETCHWLYNRTGEAFLLELAEKIYRNMAPWRDGIVNWHNVNLAQGFKAPGLFFTQSGAARDLNQAEGNYRALMDVFGQFPGGGFAGDENCRPGYTDPRQGFETCGIVEFMHSFELLTKISGDVRWADRTEELAFNSLPAALTPDAKGLHYLTCANQVQLDKNNKAPDFENSGTMVSYSPYEVYRCCQHNVSHGWPYYAEELWLATFDNGLAASLYAPSSVKAKAGNGAEVQITEETDYPFDGTVKLALTTSAEVRFPLYLRIPRWATAGAVAKVNGKKQEISTEAGNFAVIDRTWKTGDKVVLTFPMQITVRRWERNNNAASVDYGPLSFSLKIAERWEKYGNRNSNWPEYEVYPESPWNYGLVIDEKNPAKSFKVKKKSAAVGDNPFTPENVPITIEAKGQRIPNWTMDPLKVVGKIQSSPVRSSAPVERIALIPMGAARLRITSFPVIGKGPAAHEWGAN